MRRHPALGYEILRGIGFLERARLIPLHHQEKFDGTGYPSGLKGEEICIGARIFAVVDTYDAITSDRPYRKCSTYETARREIEKCAGTQLDPASSRPGCASRRRSGTRSARRSRSPCPRARSAARRDRQPARPVQAEAAARSSAQQVLQRRAQQRVAEAEAALQRARRHHPLAAQQQRLGQAAQRRAQRERRRGQRRRAGQRLAERDGELAVGHRLGRDARSARPTPVRRRWRGG